MSPFHSLLWPGIALGWYHRVLVVLPLLCRHPWKRRRRPSCFLCVFWRCLGVFSKRVHAATLYSKTTIWITTIWITHGLPPTVGFCTLGTERRGCRSSYRITVFVSQFTRMFELNDTHESEGSCDAFKKPKASRTNFGQLHYFRIAFSLTRQCHRCIKQTFDYPSCIID